MRDVLARGDRAALAELGVLVVDALNGFGETAVGMDAVGGDGGADVVGDEGGFAGGVERDVAGAGAGGGDLVDFLQRAGGWVHLEAGDGGGGVGR